MEKNNMTRIERDTKGTIKFGTMRERFSKAYPSIAEKAYEFRKMNNDELLVRLNDGTCLLYNELDYTYITLPKSRSSMTDDDYKQEFAYCLKRAMLRQEINQKELAEQSGISQGNISEYLSAKHLPNYIHICKLANAFHCSIADFRYR